MVKAKKFDNLIQFGAMFLKTGGMSTGQRLVWNFNSVGDSYKDILVTFLKPSK